MWVDTYDYAIRAEWLGVGVWGNRHAAPLWTADEIGPSILKVISADRGPVYRQKATALAPPSTEMFGRIIAAKEIVKILADQRHSLLEESSSNTVPTGSTTFAVSDEL
jgi:hypothetical protein